ncbi:hypothetical protein CRE_27610 [Caenorhabditis remanei]|uniref:Uncharacterized protein n=1 Tax=Caenorhabditis remanei TaxID=31234 RepID=E3MKI0_CAERE|nr:hypothetical protein CRE_27610 [Caenorhabditis remanei]
MVDYKSDKVLVYSQRMQEKRNLKCILQKDTIVAFRSRKPVSGTPTSRVSGSLKLLRSQEKSIFLLKTVKRYSELKHTYKFLDYDRNLNLDTLALILAFRCPMTKPLLRSISDSYFFFHFSGYWDKNIRPVSSPDLNPMDFIVWKFLKISEIFKSTAVALKKAVQRL